ncbi:MAG: L,D-transpeptidase [Candidatus Thiodiazotropha sp. (ex Lucinoma kastoroae)]|nr:L,D-transpeptidase [Candidatus Thiodiazotropha sp. (ex Rostrolucina anterorostrata)]MCU7848218.1 L,D-transpeptidase [Candidatus Thiodiazotropha sp. (ex Lucinoma kastoroae)]MCU7861549.1 L,D-transpeptidase [Candidatus Thiodiazotropha sp. (ex Lucinoma kastoroae)]
MPKLQLRIELLKQRLLCIEAGQITNSYPVSTAVNGAGEQGNSGCTPRGKHRIRLKIGEGCAENTVFVSRRPTGERFSKQLNEREPNRDWILTRILWLSGLEQGKNRGGRVDTLRRFIYIHGTPDEELIGVAASHGCIRMRNRDLLELFEQVENGTLVEIVD